MSVVAPANSEVRDLVLTNGPFGPQEIQRIGNAIAEDYTQFSVLREAVFELAERGDSAPATRVRLGVCQFLLGRFEEAAETLAKADGGAVAHFYLGKARYLLARYPEAIQSFQAAHKAGYDGDQSKLAIAEVQRVSGDPKTALHTLDALHGAVEQTAEYLYQRGATVSALSGNLEEVSRLYTRAIEKDDKHSGALFGLALENERRGNDETALRYYSRAASRVPTNVGTLLNMGVLYEDRQEYDKAQQCFQRILDEYPDHARARLYLKDAQASGDMYFDEEAQRRRDRMSQVLNVPVTDFELSVRSRNCLQKMGIKTLGDLARVTEQELLGSKNFGETSLVEIREMLGSRGLELGMLAHERPESEPVVDMSTMSPDEQALLERPITELNLSVRARKCMVRLGMNTIGELVRKTGDELLECKNFGVTSLNEVREKLTTYNLKLRGE